MELPVFQGVARSSRALPFFLRSPSTSWTQLPAPFRQRYISTSGCRLGPPRTPLASQVRTTPAEPTKATASPGNSRPPSTWPVRELPAYPPPNPIKDATGSNPFDSNPPFFDDAEWKLGTGANSFDFLSRMRPKEKHLRLVPSTGRSVYVTANVDAPRAFQLMNALCRQNSVAADFRQQRFHERGGLKRKRLRRTRWRKKFKAGFQAAAARVRELSRQGW